MNDEVPIQEEIQEELDFDNMSDDEFLNQSPSAGSTAGEEPMELDDDALGEAPETVVEDEAISPAPAETKPAETQPKADGSSPADATAEVTAGDVSKSEKQTTPNQTTAPAVAAVAAEPQNYETMYKEIMAPFKANGKEFIPSSPEEAKRLMQMGANYTKKMQSLKPNLQLMRMLENNNLLDASKISFMIDLDKKNPAAIQKLLHDGKIDPLDLDPSLEPTYKPGNHRVTDQEYEFHDVLSEVAATETGKETIITVNKWDDASKQAVFDEPVLLKLFDEQRSNGIYAKICAEIDRQQTLGQLSNIPFIHAYKQVGDRLHAAGQLGSQPQSPQAIPVPEIPSRQVLETRPGAPRQQVSNGEKARAASPGSRAPAKTSPREFDPFSMSDAEIMAIQAPRM